MRRVGAAGLLCVVLLGAPLVWAGGFGSDSPPGRIPVPAKDWRVEVEDTGGTVHTVTRASFNGEVYLYGTLGAAQVTVPFANIAQVQFSAGPSPETRAALVRDHSGDELRVVVDDDVPCYGRTQFGNVRVDVRDVRRLTVLGETEAEAK